jgi:hypothetical protein
VGCVTTDGSVSAGSVPVWGKVSRPHADRKSNTKMIKMQNVRFNQDTPSNDGNRYLYSKKIDNICQADREKQSVFVGYIPEKTIFLEIIDKKHG